MDKKQFDKADMLSGFGFILTAIGSYMMVASIGAYQGAIKKSLKEKEDGKEKGLD